MSELSSLFESCPAVVPQFKVLITRPNPPQPEAKEQLSGAEKRLKIKTDKQKKAEKLEKERVNDPRESRTVFVGNLSLPCNRKLVKQLFKRYGVVECVRLRSIRVTSGDLPTKVAIRHQKQLMEGTTCNAYVVMSTIEEAEKSLALNGTSFQRRHLRVDLLGKSQTKSSGNMLNSIFVGNLPFQADEEKLRELFTPCGGVQTVRIIRDKKTGAGKGFGFITFDSKTGVMFAVQKSRRFELNGRVLRVFKAKSEDSLKARQFSGIRSGGPGKMKIKGKHLKRKKIEASK